MISVGTRCYKLSLLCPSIVTLMSVSFQWVLDATRSACYVGVSLLSCQSHFSGHAVLQDQPAMWEYRYSHVRLISVGTRCYKISLLCGSIVTLMSVSFQWVRGATRSACYVGVSLLACQSHFSGYAVLQDQPAMWEYRYSHVSLISVGTRCYKISLLCGSIVTLMSVSFQWVLDATRSVCYVGVTLMSVSFQWVRGATRSACYVGVSLLACQSHFSGYTVLQDQPAMWEYRYSHVSLISVGTRCYKISLLCGSIVTRMSVSFQWVRGATRSACYVGVSLLSCPSHFSGYAVLQDQPAMWEYRYSHVSLISVGTRCYKISLLCGSIVTLMSVLESTLNRFSQELGLR